MVPSLFCPFFAKSVLKKAEISNFYGKNKFFITNLLILLHFIDLESYLHWGTFAKNRMSVSIRILEILILFYQNFGKKTI